MLFDPYPVFLVHINSYVLYYMYMYICALILFMYILYFIDNHYSVFFSLDFPKCSPYVNGIFLYFIHFIFLFISSYKTYPTGTITWTWNWNCDIYLIVGWMNFDHLGHWIERTIFFLTFFLYLAFFDFRLQRKRKIKIRLCLIIWFKKNFFSVNFRFFKWNIHT